MKFSYTALTKDNRKITGILDVENEEAAKAELHKMEVAIISVKEISEDEYKIFEKAEEAGQKEKGIQTFTFLALDLQKKEVEGTIDALDDYSAYKRLRTEYHFEVKELYSASATAEEKKLALAKLPEFSIRYNQEKVTPKEQKISEADESKIDEAENRINEEVIVEIDKVIINAKKTIEVHQNLFSNDLLREIDEKLGELERIRTSNNIKHITEVSNDLYTLVSNPDKLEEGVKNEAYQTLMDEISESALVKREFDLYKKAVEASGLKKVLKKVGNKIKKITEITEEEEREAGFFTKLKASIHRKMEAAAEKKAKKAALAAQIATKKKGAFSELLEKISTYFKAESPVLKKTRKRELTNAFKKLFGKKEKKGEIISDEKKIAAKPAQPEKKKTKRDFTNLFIEVDSFLAWLLTFYIIFFFLVSFSLEKEIGLKPEFIFRTMDSPILLNISIFLLWIHFVFRFRNIHLKHRFFHSLFVIAIGLGAYVLLILNF